MRFSVVVPTYNAARHIGRCLDSLAAQTLDPAEFEVLVADDASQDGSADLAEAHRGVRHLKVLRRGANGGPGAARNLGMAEARGEWILFLDSDDRLRPEALATLAAFIDARAGEPLDLVGFDWAYETVREDLASSRRSGRRDAAFLADPALLLERYAQMRMDMSVIYNAYRREMLAREGLTFAEGLHEDVDFAFGAYAGARGVAYLDATLYEKTNTATSIVNGISARHLEGFLRAWRDVGARIAALPGSQLPEAYRWGTVGAVATRVREIVRHAPDAAAAAPLLARLDVLVRDMFPDFPANPTLLSGRTVYHRIARHFIETMDSKTLSPTDKAADVARFAKDLEGKSWSCQDLHHSAFLAPDEVRTCCKRFFVDGEMRGDVVLFKTEGDVTQPVAPERILKAKQALHQAINSGEPTACDGCPFLEFKAWPQLNKLKVDYLSMEQHSICNLECTYCSETYFGGAKPAYDIEKTVEGLLDDGAMEDCSIVVWGGGDPVVVKEFTPLISKIVERTPRAQQRVLTNSIKHSAVLQDLMVRGRAHVITSLDAGTEETFRKVRGRPGFRKACANIKTYAETGKVTIKYIFTEGNSHTSEVRAFVEAIQEWGLLDCSFQISSDFKQEVIPFESAVNMALMFGLLRKAGSTSVIFDELLRIRLAEVLAGRGQAFVDEAHRLAGFPFIASPERYPSVVVWGAGQQAVCLADSLFFQTSEIAYFVDSTPSKIGTTYLGREVRDPAVLASTDEPILIAAVQAYPFILAEFRRMNLDPGRLVTDLVI